MVRQDEEGSPPFPTEEKLQGPFGHIDAADLLAVGGIDEDLPIGDIDPPLRIHRDALPSPIREGPEVGDRAARAQQAAIGAVFRTIGEEDALALLPLDEAIAVE